MIKVILTEKAKELEEKGLRILPSRGTNLAAGMDLAACIDEEVTIYPGKITKIPTGVKIFLGINQIEERDFQLAGLYLPRSSNSQLVLANTVGLLDCDYQGESFLKVTAREESFVIKPGDRIAQLVIFPAIMFDWEVVETFDEVTQRAEGGDGSTGGNYVHK
jgi:deoxyuridine 5'-triphosphate nucleotidohydrolase